MAKQVCEQCGEVIIREPEAAPLVTCPKCQAKLPVPHIISPKSAQLGATGGTR
jgi:predicted nucleic acid-binding Zn ribbon protein